MNVKCVPGRGHGQVGACGRQGVAWTGPQPAWQLRRQPGRPASRASLSCQGLLASCPLSWPHCPCSRLSHVCCHPQKLAPSDVAPASQVSFSFSHRISTQHRTSAIDRVTFTRKSYSGHTMQEGAASTDSRASSAACQQQRQIHKIRADAS